MIETRDWYGRDWKLLRSQLIMLCLKFSDPFLLKIQNKELELEEAIRVLFDEVTQYISNLIPQDKNGLWQHTLPLFDDPKWFCQELQKDLFALQGEKQTQGGTVSPKQALGQKFKNFFEKNRRAIIANDLGLDSSNRVKNWDRLDSISRSINVNNSSSNRCNDEHFETLAAHIRRHHPNDKNLVKTPKKIKEYFLIFSKDCFDNLSEKYLNKITVQDIEELLNREKLQVLADCVDRLSDKERELIDFSFKLQLSEVNYISEKAFRESQNLSKRDYLRERSRIMEQLNQCLEIVLTSKIGGTGI